MLGKGGLLLTWDDMKMGVMYDLFSGLLKRWEEPFIHLCFMAVHSYTVRSTSCAWSGGSYLEVAQADRIIAASGGHSRGVVGHLKERSSNLESAIGRIWSECDTF